MEKLTRRAFLSGSVLAGGALFLTACGGNTGGMNHGGGTSTPYDQNFIDAMVPHHQSAIDMAKVAQGKAEHAEIKALANNIVTSQDGEIVRMKGWRKGWYGSEQIAPGMGGHTMGGMNMDLGVLASAQPFDKAFIDAMIPHHQSAIDMGRDAQKQAQHQEIKDLATEIIAAQQRELDQMKTWRAQWYPGQ